MNTFSNLTNTLDLMINVFVKDKIKRKYQKLKQHKNSRKDGDYVKFYKPKLTGQF